MNLKINTTTERLGNTAGLILAGAISKKEGVSRTYNGYDGYALIFCYIGTEG